MLSYYTYEHQESTTWVTFVHGAGGSSSIWFKQVREFKKHFNVLLLDLRGHGNSKPSLKDAFNDKYTFDSITEDIVEVIDHLKIEKSHFIGISLGTMKLDFRSQILMQLGLLFQSIVPYLWLYKFFAFIIMPHRNHKESRILFVREAKKLYQQEFTRWFKLTSEINPLLRVFRAVDTKIPTLYVMGGEDYLFLPAVKKIVQKHTACSLLTIEYCGHVVNVEQPQIFNHLVIGYVADTGH